MTINERFFSLLDQNGFSQKDFSLKTGIPQQTISGWKTRKSDPPAQLLSSIADYFGVSIEYLVTGKSNSDSLTANEHNFLYLYRSLTPQDKEKVYNFVEIATQTFKPNYVISTDTDSSTKALTAQIPILGYVAAGSPIIAYENPLSFVDTYNRLVSYALYTKGNSMEPVIYDGEIIEIIKTNVLKNGEIGIIQIDNEVTCKKFYRYSDHIELVPFNPDYESIQIFKNDLKNVKILGKVVLNDTQSSRL